MNEGDGVSQPGARLLVACTRAHSGAKACPPRPTTIETRRAELAARARGKAPTRAVRTASRERSLCIAVRSRGPCELSFRRRRARELRSSQLLPFEDGEGLRVLMERARLGARDDASASRRRAIPYRPARCARARARDRLRRPHADAVGVSSGEDAKRESDTHPRLGVTAGRQHYMHRYRR